MNKKTGKKKYVKPEVNRMECVLPDFKDLRQIQPELSVGPSALKKTPRP